MKYVFFVSVLLSIHFSFAQQNVGIGTNTPTEKLHVSGNVKADTIKPTAIQLTPNAGAGKVLTSDATGNASWAQGNTATANIGYGTWGDCGTNAIISEYQPAGDSTGISGSFGDAVAVSGNWAIIGARNNDNGANTDQGLATIFKFDGTKWVHFARLFDSPGFSNDYFGASVSISGNYAMVGVPGDDANKGSARIYFYNGSNWVLSGTITDPSGAAGDQFGYSVSIYDNYAIAGAVTDDVGINNSQGSACVFRYNGTGWVFQQKLTDPIGATSDEFGYSVSIDRGRAVIGAASDDVGANADAGSVSIFQFNGTNWLLEEKINGISSQSHFGKSVSVSGNYLAVGVPDDDVTYNAVTDNDEGAAYVYRRDDAGSWNNAQRVRLFRPGGGAYEYFGNCVSISGDYLLIGIYQDAVGTSLGEGSSTLYININANNWQRLLFITDPAGESGQALGSAVSIDGYNKRFVIGAQGGFAGRGKAIFGKVN